MNKLNIFVSSTCYDLSQIRTDLYESISSLGYNPILSEFPNFPVNPTNNNLAENCIEVINKSVDIFVLILGNKYGHKLETGKSITNIEFLTAKNKNIPIYIFISKQILHLLPVYLKNKNADYSNIVDTPEIFEFANEVRNNSGIWSFEFERFQDIQIALKIQLSYLFKESLLLRNRFHSNKDLDFHSKLSEKALKIILAKEAAYEYEFFSQVLIDELSKYEVLKNDYEYKIILNSKKGIKSNSDFIYWISERLTGAMEYVPNLKSIIDILIPKYMNKHGKPADLKGLYYVANTYSRVCKSFIDWSIETLSVPVEDNQKEIRNVLAEMTSNLIESMWNFPFEFNKNVLAAKIRLQNGEPDISLKMELKIAIADEVMNRYFIAINEFKNSMQ